MVKYGSSSSVATKEEETMKWDGRNHPFIEFDQFIMNWCRTKWNNETGKALWEDTYPDELFEIPESSDIWIDHCMTVYKCEMMTDYKQSQTLYKDDYFWTHEYQEIWMNRQRELLYSKVEKSVVGVPKAIVQKLSGGKVKESRQVLKKKYGNARAVSMETRQGIFDLGMPPTDAKDIPTGPAFEERTNLEDKFQELEDEQVALMTICPEKHRDEYKYGKESHLVRVVKKHIHKSYYATLRGVENLHRIRSNGGLAVREIDIHEHSYTDDHLPPWQELKDALLEEYHENSKGWGAYAKEQNGVPTMLIQNGSERCFGCGEEGHRRGAKECSAGPRDVHHTAPDWVKERAKGGKPRSGGPGKKGNQICRFFKNNGTCRFGDKCKFEHVKGNGSTKGNDGWFGEKSNRKRVATSVMQLISSDLEKEGKRRKSDEGSSGKSVKANAEVSRLYGLITSSGGN